VFSAVVAEEYKTRHIYTHFPSGVSNTESSEGMSVGSCLSTRTHAGIMVVHKLMTCTIYRFYQSNV